MKNLATILVASASLLASAATASAASFGGIAAGAGVLRTTNWVAQGTNVAALQSINTRVTLCSGVNEYPVFVAVGPSTAVAVGSCYTISATIVSPTQTEFNITHIGGADGVKKVIFGTVNTHCAFDRTAPSPGTPGSFAGLDIAPVAMAGAWTVNANYTNAVQLVGAPPIGDLYCTLGLSFSSCFDVGDVFLFRVDTDTIN